MSQKKKWFKSVFQDDHTDHTPATPKKSRQSDTIDLTLDDFDEFDTSWTLLPDPTTQLNETGSKKPPAALALPPKNFNPASSNWIEIFEPGTVTELAVHAKKQAEVQDWLRHYEVTKKKFPGQMLLITGPAGSGKTATIKAMAKETKYEVVEWITPVDVDLVRSTGQAQVDGETFRESQLEVFKQFLFKSSRYKSVFDDLQRRLILVEDFPNVFVRDSEGFEEVLQNYRDYGKSPLVFIVTDSKSRQLNLAYNLFPDNIKGQYQITHVSFNPVSSTLMKKALTRICNLMQQDGFSQHYKVPASNVIDSINLSSQGDIRNAVINIHFASLKGAPSLETNKGTTSRATSKTGKGKPKGKSLKSIGRDESITMMHALGRVFNPKYEENSKLPLKFLHSPEDIADAFSSEPKMFVNFLHSNYLAHFTYVEDTLKATDSLSVSDVAMTEYREDVMGHVGLNIAIRGLMVANKKPVSGWLPVRGIKRKESQRGKLEEEMKRLGVKHELSQNVLISDYRTYVRIIKSSGMKS